MSYVLSTKILQGADTVEMFFQKDVLEFVAKILDEYTNKEFLKVLSKTKLLHIYFSRILITTILQQWFEICS